MMWCALLHSERIGFKRFVAITAAALGCIGLGCDPPGKPLPAQQEEQQANTFEALYAQSCSGCHGADGKNGPARPLNSALYLAIIPRETLRATIENGRPGTAMPAWERSKGGPLSSEQITILVDGIEKNWSKPQKLNDPPSYSSEGRTGDVTRGKRLFARNCFLCHGQPAIGAVTDPAFLQLVSDQMLRSSIIEGRPDLGMPDYRNLNMGRPLSDQDITDLVAYLVSLRPNAETASSK